MAMEIYLIISSQSFNPFNIALIISFKTISVSLLALFSLKLTGGNNVICLKRLALDCRANSKLSLNPEAEFFILVISSVSISEKNNTKFEYELVRFKKLSENFGVSWLNLKLKSSSSVANKLIRVFCFDILNLSSLICLTLSNSFVLLSIRLVKSVKLFVIELRDDNILFEYVFISSAVLKTSMEIPNS